MMMTPGTKTLLDLINSFKTRHVIDSCPPPTTKEEELILLLKGYEQSLVGLYWIRYGDYRND
jgi:hypothetical protein